MAGWLQRFLKGPSAVSLELAGEPAELAAGYLLEMDEALEAILELDGLEFFRETGEVPARFFEHWEQALAAYDRYVDTVLGNAGPDGRGLPVTCGSGCHACCHDAPTGMQAIELVHIYATYRRFSDFERLHNRACDLADALLDCVRELEPKAKQVMSDSKTYRRALLRYAGKRLPCVFLAAETHECRIYDARPIPCRMHFSVTDPQLCWYGAPDSNKARPLNVTPPDAIVQLMKRIAERMGLSELSPVLFQGIAQLGGDVMKAGPVTVASDKKTKRRKR